jgi:hypothetical protein
MAIERLIAIPDTAYKAAAERMEAARDNMNAMGSLFVGRAAP